MQYFFSFKTQRKNKSSILKYLESNNCRLTANLVWHWNCARCFFDTTIIIKQFTSQFFQFSWFSYNPARIYGQSIEVLQHGFGIKILRRQRSLQIFWFAFKYSSLWILFGGNQIFLILNSQKVQKKMVLVITMDNWLPLRAYLIALLYKTDIWFSNYCFVGL